MYHYVAEQKLPSPQSKYQSKQGGGRGEVGSASTLFSLPSHWLLRAAPKSHLLCSPWELEEETEVHWNFKSLFEAGLEMRSHSSVQKHTNKQGFPCRVPSFSSVCAWAPCLVQHLFLPLPFQFYPKERSRWTRQLMSHLNTVVCPTWPTKAAGLRTPAGFTFYGVQIAHAALTSPAVLVYTSTLPEDIRGARVTHLSPGL